VVELRGVTDNSGGSIQHSVLSLSLPNITSKLYIVLRDYTQITVFLCISVIKIVCMMCDISKTKANKTESKQTKLNG